jgi:hypothetical protein
VSESEWLSSGDPESMLAVLRPNTTERKLRLFAMACCRRHWDWPLEDMDEPGSSWIASIREAVGVGERLADGQATPLDLRTVQSLDGCGVEILYAFIGCSGTGEELFDVSGNLIDAAGESPGCSTAAQSAKAAEAEKSAQAVLIREIFGSPFRPVALDPTWLTPTVISLAQTAYAERLLLSGELDTARLAVLADALEEAGCQDAQLLEHLRSPGPHVRGCWPVDLIAAKE